MASTSIPNLDSNPARKRRKIDTKPSDTKTDTSKWKTVSQQQIYSKNLLSALRQSRRNTSSPPSSAVRVAADRALAAAAKGRTRWSRAILTSRLRLKLSRNNNKHKKAKVAKTNHRTKKPVNHRKVPAVQKKVRVLSRLVPGCEKVSFPNLLEEATDYIAALEMQVRAMTALADLLTGGGTGLSIDRVGSNVS